MRRGPVLLAAAAGAVAAGGAVIAATWHLSFGHGLYCSLGVATTVGCDVQPPGTAGRVAAAAVMLTTIPLLAAAFGQIHLDRVRAHLDRHHRAIHDRLDAIEGNGHRGGGAT